MRDLPIAEARAETLGILGDPELMASLRQGIKEAGQGKGIPWETVKKKLRL